MITQTTPENVSQGYTYDIQKTHSKSYCNPAVVIYLPQIYTRHTIIFLYKTALDNRYSYMYI